MRYLRGLRHDMSDLPGGVFLYKAWLIWPPQNDQQMWSASKSGLIRTGATEGEVKRQIDAHENDED